MGVKHLMVSESKSRCGRTVVQGDGADCKNCARVKWIPTGQVAETAGEEAVEASTPVEGDYVYRDRDGSQGMVDDKTRHGRLVVVFDDGTERSVHWDVLVGEGYVRVAAAEYAEGDVVKAVARLHYLSRTLYSTAYRELGVTPDVITKCIQHGLIIEFDEYLSATSAAVELLTEADKVDAYLHFNPRPAVPPINSGIPHVFVPKAEGVEGGPSFCVAPCHGHKSMPFHVSAVVRPVKLRQPVRTCLARRKRKATKRARARVGGGW